MMIIFGSLIDERVISRSGIVSSLAQDDMSQLLLAVFLESMRLYLEFLAEGNDITI
jgi:hypothetical protein